MKFLEKILPAITALFLAAFVAYCAAWYFGKIESNFALILFVASSVTGVYWLFERLYFLPRRRERAAAAAEKAAAAEQKRRGVDSQGFSADKNGNRIVMSNELGTRMGIINFLKSAGVDDMEAAKRIGEVVTSRVIARPHNDIEKIASQHKA